MRTIDYTDSQLDDDEIMEMMARDEAMSEHEKWQNGKRMEIARHAAWVGGSPGGGTDALRKKWGFAC
jgi:hypothetical protein